MAALPRGNGNGVTPRTKNGPALVGYGAITTKDALLVVTHVVSDGLTIRGATTWVAATIVVWLVALAARLLLPVVMFKKALGRASARPG